MNSSNILLLLCCPVFSFTINAQVVSDPIEITEFRISMNDAAPTSTTMFMMQKLKKIDIDSFSSVFSIFYEKSYTLEKCIREIRRDIKTIQSDLKSGLITEEKELTLLNDIFFTDKKASIFKNHIIELEKVTVSIIDMYKFDPMRSIDKIGLSITMETLKEKTWEEYLFKDMTSLSVLPLLQVYSNKLLDTKYYICRSLSKYYK